MGNEKTADTGIMAANQQAYNTDGAKDENGDYIIKDGKRIHVGGAKQININKAGESSLLGDDEITSQARDENRDKTLIRTDVDSHQNFRTPNLQNQEGGSNEIGYTGSSLNITAYNVYEGDGSQATKPSSVVVGVAGSSEVREFF